MRWRDVYSLLPYFLYGLFYNVLLFGDRLNSWTAHTHTSPLVVEFRGDYETAWNLGLIGFVFQAGWVQMSVAAFYRELPMAQRHLGAHQVERFRQAVQESYSGRLLSFIPVALASSLVPIWLAAGPLRDHLHLSTAAWSVVAFPLLVLGLWQVSLLIGLARPWHAAAAAGAGSAVDLLAGYLLSRAGDHHQAVMGFVLGALTFALLSGRWTRQALRQADYFWYKATS